MGCKGKTNKQPWMEEVIKKIESRIGEVSEINIISGE